ncbi:serine/threonine protein kinase [Capronia epimyces CBS 606.96]|uniref:non-specific serine/threonine protein kinase n=1 Tax=Capronia epimyces CBS 606.96 TaxID=1182542 RepID=W9YH86_9EURO|nr:serine/threonine protein kinase [Capronia epimyces CBS 606.96]EXJ92262.1 serine/threonine protein kinase [Capronia epimyces CBS 606.96]
MARIGLTHLDEPDFNPERYLVDYDPANFHPRKVGKDLNQQWYDARKHRGAFGGKVESEVFMLRDLHFEEDPDHDAEWGPVRLLGAGAYGRVGLWQKRNAKNVLIDELALKESILVRGADVKRTEGSKINQDRPRLLKEAVIQHDLNVKDERAAPHLRRYKFVSDHRSNKEGRYRMYLEFCPHGSLDHLRRLYRAWDHYLPEVFVWHVFHRLAISCEALRDQPPAESLAIELDKFSSIWDDQDDEALICLHMDMKPQNVLLGYEPEDPEENDYPEPKLSDFGLSEYTGPSDDRNPLFYWWRGTTAYKATEQISYGAHWVTPPNGAMVRTHDDRKRRLDYKRAKHMQRVYNQANYAGDVSFDHSLNVYGVGTTMYAVATLAKDRRLMRIRAKHYKKYRQNGNHQISKVRTKLPGVYSSRLRELIRRCIDPDPSNRPSQLELMDATRKGLRVAEDRALRAREKHHAETGGSPDEIPPPLPSEKLYYHDHEINNLPQGPAGFKPLMDDFNYLIRDEFVNPDIPRLKLPAAKYRKFPDSWNKPKANWRTLYSKTNREYLWFRPVN